VKANATDLPPPVRPAQAPIAAQAPTDAVTELYRVHALGLIRLAVVMLGDRPAAEDVVQEAFCGLYRRWHSLSDTGKALSYVRSSVINGCRTVLRRRLRQGGADPSTADPAGESAEAVALVGEEHRQVLTAIRRLPSRQREVLILRFYLDLDEAETAVSMRISRGTVKSTTWRALAALGQRRVSGHDPALAAGRHDGRGDRGQVLIGVINAGGRNWVGVISGNKFTPLNARWALSMTQGLNDFGTW
jgi:RNA polymerase sigma-70 factor (sigma-E family)